jgi:hypothetical protein
MTEINQIVKEAREYAVSEIEKYGLPPLILFEIAEENAIRLSKEFDADLDIIKIGMCLMDLKLGQAVKENKESEHVKMSVQSAGEFLDKFKIHNLTKEKIINCVESHHSNVHFESIEAEICANADCYKFIHPKGFLAYFTILGKRGLDLNEILKRVEEKLDEKYNILSLEICKKELDDYYKNFKKYIEEAKQE